MKSVRIHSYGGSDQIKVEEMPRPEPGQDEVLVKIFDAGVNPIDWKIRSGLYKDRGESRFPLTLGQDFAGVVEEIGPGVTEYKEGDRVFGFARGSYAEFASVPVKDLAHTPRNIDNVTAASIPTAGLTAWQVVIDTARVSGGQRILIHGAAGGVGSFAVQLAKWKNAHVTATAARDDFAYLEGIGTDRIIDYKTQRFEDVTGKVDAVIDLVGGETLNRSYGVVNANGIVVTTVGPLDVLETRKLGISGVQFYMRPDSMELSRLADLIDKNIIKPRLSQVIPLAEARRAQDINQSGHSHGKIVLEVIPGSARAG